MLSREEVELYRRDGYLPGRRLLSAAEAERLRDDCLRTCAEPLVLGDQNPYSLKRHASNRVKPYLLFPWAAELVRHTSILDVVEAVIGPDILVFHTTVWLKPPRSENYVPWHQDATYFGLAPLEHITAWVALTPSRPESGCTTRASLPISTITTTRSRCCRVGRSLPTVSAKRMRWTLSSNQAMCHCTTRSPCTVRARTGAM